MTIQITSFANGYEYDPNVCAYDHYFELDRDEPRIDNSRQRPLPTNGVTGQDEGLYVLPPGYYDKDNSDGTDGYPVKKFTGLNWTTVEGYIEPLNINNMRLMHKIYNVIGTKVIFPVRRMGNWVIHSNQYNTFIFLAGDYKLADELIKAYVNPEWPISFTHVIKDYFKALTGRTILDEGGTEQTNEPPLLYDSVILPIDKLYDLFSLYNGISQNDREYLTKIMMYNRINMDVHITNTFTSDKYIVHLTYGNQEYRTTDGGLPETFEDNGKTITVNGTEYNKQIMMWFTVYQAWIPYLEMNWGTFNPNSFRIYQPSSVSSYEGWIRRSSETQLTALNTMKAICTFCTTEVGSALINNQNITWYRLESYGSEQLTTYVNATTTFKENERTIHGYIIENKQGIKNNMPQRDGESTEDWYKRITGNRFTADSEGEFVYLFDTELTTLETQVSGLRNAQGTNYPEIEFDLSHPFRNSTARKAVWEGISTALDDIKNVLNDTPTELILSIDEYKKNPGLFHYIYKTNDSNICMTQVKLTPSKYEEEWTIVDN